MMLAAMPAAAIVAPSLAVEPTRRLFVAPAKCCTAPKCGRAQVRAVAHVFPFCVEHCFAIPRDLRHRIVACKLLADTLSGYGLYHNALTEARESFVRAK